MRVVAIRMAWALAATLTATVILAASFIQWRDTSYGNTVESIEKPDSALWGDAFITAFGTVGTAAAFHVLLNVAATRRYPVSRWTYWLSFLLVVAWATWVTRNASVPISDAGVLYIFLPLAWVLSLGCLVVGVVELAIRTGTKASPST
jgi:hypothetical protein